MKEREDHEEGELVLLPTLKQSKRTYDDPLEELLNEFAELDEEFALGEKKRALEKGLYDQIGEQLKERDSLKEQLESLKEIQSRLKYFLDEIEAYYPY